ncbi:class I SAM-dependent methyltransferase [Chitinophaga lutea]|uniref:Class I SAM-dependent methyltransferase n=1 Tax=Chitinophaga lutea TaxID=2488634 RepID=A0A3N4PBG8_9BACT|nr:class I SAM-dependent methyltransferase [Chitinophaga lutea]RPE05445.1 class I SAM-dependent methyltransferase [Chitinophaga lutea]
MKLKDAISLLLPAGIEQTTPQQWADLGSGEYLFTHALATLLAPRSRIYAVDKIAMPPEKGEVDILPVKADFVADELPLEALDGILMANSLHYVADKPAFLKKTAAFFRKQPLYIVVEYDTEVPVPVWVPYPVSYAKLEALAAKMGYNRVQRLGSYESLYGGTMYAAVIQG